MTCILIDKTPYTNLLRILNSFGECSGLKVNDEKTEIMPLGDNILQEKDFPTHSICEIIKILGIYFGYDDRKRNNLNFSQTLKSIKKSINVWKSRGLSLLGRIQIVKTFAIPKFMFRASVISVSKELIKEAKSVLYNFVWIGKDKVRRLALISDIEMGGLKMLDIPSMICAQRITCLKKLLEDYSSHWKVILGKLLSTIGGRFILHYKFQTSKCKINLPARLQVVMRKLLIKLPGTTNFFATTKINAQKRYGKLRFCGDFSCNFSSLTNPEKRSFLLSIIDLIPTE